MLQPERWITNVEHPSTFVEGCGHASSFLLVSDEVARIFIDAANTAVFGEAEFDDACSKMLDEAENRMLSDQRRYLDGWEK